MQRQEENDLLVCGWPQPLPPSEGHREYQNRWFFWSTLGEDSVTILCDGNCDWAVLQPVRLSGSFSGLM